MPESANLDQILDPLAPPQGAVCSNSIEIDQHKVDISSFALLHKDIRPLQVSVVDAGTMNPADKCR